MGNAHFIAIEGIDGAGKRTQIELLTGWLDARGMAHQRISFPRYDSFFGRMVGQFLDGAFGPLDRVDAHLSALLYASDRFEAKRQLEKNLRQQGSILVADRYIASNLAHQTARVPPEQREEFLRWLKQLEYEVYSLPVEDLVIYLRVPARVAQQQVAQKSARGYTTRSHDIQEADLRHLEEAAKVYDALARASNWVTVECFDATANRMRAPDTIHRDVVKALETLDIAAQEVRK
ncbi:MAG: thymidylate kinase [Candidatus Acidiferrales bacterium]